MEFLDRKGKMSQLAGLFAILNLKAEADNQLKTREAESAHIRRTLWGADEAMTTEDDMATTVVFGDMNQRSGLSTLAKLGIGAALISSGVGAGLGGALLLDAFRRPAAVAPVTPQPGTSTTIERDYEIGPVKIEPPSLFDLQEP